MKETHNVDEYCINNRAEKYNMTLYIYIKKQAYGCAAQ